MNKTFRLYIAIGMLLCAFPAVYAQVSASELLEWTKQHLNKGDCDKARETYELYKEKVPSGNADVKRRIDECGKESQIIIPNGYVDLGLPSGILWKKENEIGYFTDTEISEFENNLPTTEQFGELLEHCVWIKTNDGYQVVGTNGNVVFLPAIGLKNIYSSEREREANGQLYYLTRDFYYSGDYAGYDMIHKWVFVISEGTINYICSSPGESYSVRFVYKK